MNKYIVTLFYSHDEKRLFYIAGYTDQSYNVKAIVSMLNNNANYFRTQCNLPDNALIQTDFITKSRRYKSMRYFWVDGIETPPEDAFVIGKGENKWTMQQWLEN